jgi:hypothetical protein
MQRVNLRLEERVILEHTASFLLQRGNEFRKARALQSVKHHRH